MDPLASPVIRQHLENGLLTRSAKEFLHDAGPDLLARAEAFFIWMDSRRTNGFWPYANSLFAPPGPRSLVAPDCGPPVPVLNFASQDYLGLTSHPKVRTAALAAVERFGPHSAGSTVLQGNTAASLSLERALARASNAGSVALFPTGWAACFGVIVALVRPDDHIIIDCLAHNSLQQGAAAATKNVHRVPHLSTEAIAGELATIRMSHKKTGILVVTEGLFSMDADTPDLCRLSDVCREHGAFLLVDVAHDFGSMGADGLGSISEFDLVGKIDLVVGSFSKTFGSNGGFVLCHSPAVREYLRYFSPSSAFSNALSPVQCAVVEAAVDIVFSHEGEALRSNLLHNSILMRQSLASVGMTALGRPSPIVPIPLGSETVARLTACICGQRGLTANLVEFPAVAPGRARFRIQLMSTHTDDDIMSGVSMLASAYKAANSLANSVGSDASQGNQARTSAPRSGTNLRIRAAT